MITRAERSDIARERRRRKARIKRGVDPDYVPGPPYHVKTTPSSMTDRKEYFRNRYLNRTREPWEEVKA